MIPRGLRSAAGVGGGAGAIGTIGSLTNVDSSADSAATGTILVRGTGTTFRPTTISAGANVTVTNEGDGTITIAATATQGGGGGGPLALGSLTDVDTSGVAANRLLSYVNVGGDSKWRPILAGAANIADGAVTSGKLEISAGTASLADSDGVMVKDGTAWQSRTKRFMESSLHSVHTKDIDLTGYTMATGVLPTVAGEAKILSTSVNGVTTYTLAVFPEERGR